MTTPTELVKKRPAESAMPIFTVIAILISKVIGVEDTDTIVYMALALSFVPAVVTWTVDLIRQKDKANGTTYKPPDSS